MEKILEWDRDLLIYLNSFHHPFLDPIVYFLTDTFAWTPLYLLLIYFLYKKYGSSIWMSLSGIVIAIILADQITSGVMKPLFKRLRPSHEPSLKGILHLVNNYEGGTYGFASSHAANTFATATFFWLIFRRDTKHIGWLFVWALLLTYTRIYLGVHYPGDIIVGAAVGIASGFAGFYSFRYIENRLPKGEDIPKV